MRNCPRNKGFSLPEVLITLSILAILFALSSVNLQRVIPSASLNEALEIFLADSKSWQIQAIVGVSNDSNQYAYGIKFMGDKYVLFRGDVYDEGNPLNYEVKLPNNLSISSTFLNNELIFNPIYGDIRNFDPSLNRVVITGPSNFSTTILFNKLGNVYYISRSL